jgi:uncharacterized repeat protein (TIGR01451 family)/MYXO-CTERM domain-containing protein
MGGINGQGQLGSPWGATGWTVRGNFFDLGNDRGYGKLYIDPRDTAFYLAVNTAAKASLPAAQLEAAFINPANWTWHDGNTGAPTTPIAHETSDHDLKEGWLVPRSSPTPEWTIIYDAGYSQLSTGGRNLGYFGPTADLEVRKTLDTPPPYWDGDQVEYTVTVINNGPTKATNVTLVEQLTNQTLDSVQVVSCPSGSNCSCSSGTCTIDVIQVGDQAEFKVTATISGAGTFANTAQATADQLDPDPANSTAAAGAQADPPLVPTLGETALVGLVLLLTLVALRRRKMMVG